MSDIYQIAKDPMYQNADYYDMSSGIIYHTADYNHAIRLGLPTPWDYVYITRWEQRNRKRKINHTNGKGGIKNGKRSKSISIF